MQKVGKNRRVSRNRCVFDISSNGITWTKGVILITNWEIQFVVDLKMILNEERKSVTIAG